MKLSQEQLQAPLARGRMRHMQIYRLFRLIILSVVAIMFAACASEPPRPLPTPTALPRAAVVPITLVLAEPQRWSGQEITIVGPIALTGEDRVLIASLEEANDPGSVRPDQAIWLEQQPPESIRNEIVNSEGSILKIRGTISPPGAYGRDQQFPYQLSTQTMEVVQPERTTLANLAQNPQALDQILLSVGGTLLAQQSSALLTDQVSEGGVPTGLHQIKLSRPSIDQSLLQKLKSSGEVRWGEVQVVGWWQDGTLAPFKIELAQAD